MRTSLLLILVACLPTAASDDKGSKQPAPADSKAARRLSDEEAEAAFPAFHKRLQAKRERIEADLPKRKREPWEGHFSNGNPFWERGFVICKKDGYVFTSRLIDMGAVTVRGDRIKLVSENPYMKGQVAEYVVIPWDKSVYLIEPSGLLSFCNRVNSGIARELGPSFGEYPRVEDFGKTPRGLPAVPTEYREYLLADRVRARLTSIGKRQVKLIPYGFSDEHEGFMATVDAGYKQGLRVGMELYPEDERVWATGHVISVANSTANVLVVYGPVVTGKVVAGSRWSTLHR